MQAAKPRQLAELCECVPAACQVAAAAISFGCLTEDELLDHPDQLHVRTTAGQEPSKLLRYLWCCRSMSSC